MPILIRLLTTFHAKRPYCLNRFGQLLTGMLLISAAQIAQADATLLNVSYDVMRDFYKDFNPAFQKYWKDQGGESVTINMSHGGSTKQARAVIDGLEADVVTMNQATDLDVMAKFGVISNDWASKFPNHAAPFSSSSVFIVRKGNPKQIRDWPDLIKADVQVVIPNPKLSGNGRYTYVSAWGWALRQSGGNATTAEAKARDYVNQLFKHVPVLDSGGRAATTTFLQRQIGDVLITFENEAEMIAREFGRGNFEVIYPSLSVTAEPPVALVEKVVDKKGTRKLAQAYLDYLYTPQGQQIAAENYLRPRDAQVLARYAGQFPKVGLFGIEELGGWTKVQKLHFDDGGIFDQLYAPGATSSSK